MKEFELSSSDTRSNGHYRNILLLASVYFLTMWYSMQFVVRPQGFTCFWMPSGLWLAWLLRSPRPEWSRLALTVFLVNLVTNLGMHHTAARSVGFGIANTGEGLLAAWFLTRCFRTPFTLHCLPQVFGLIFCAAILSNAVTGLLGAAVVVGLGSASFFSAWAVWCLTEGIGMLLVAPIVLTLKLPGNFQSEGASPRQDLSTRQQFGEALIVFGGLIAVSIFLFRIPPTSDSLYLELAYLVFPFLIAASVRFGAQGASLATFALALIVARYTQLGMGLFSHIAPEGAGRLLGAQGFIAVASISALSLAAVISERQSAETKLQESESLFRQIAEHIGQTVWLSTPTKDRMLYVNPSYETIFGRNVESLYADPISFLALILPEDMSAIQEVLRLQTLGQRTSVEYRIKRDDGSIRWLCTQSFPILDAEGKVDRVAGLVEDITERKAMQEQLYQAQKMESLGRLAGGVAHDFNNLLTAILGYAELIESSLPEDAPEIDYARHIQHAGDRAAELTRQLLMYARRQMVDLTIADLNGIVEVSYPILRRTVRAEIEIRVIPEKDLGRVRTNAGQIERILLNLVMNAQDAIAGAGRIVIETANVTLDAGYAATHVGVAPGDYVLLAISDNGTGMTPEVRKNLFEPFFTTKAQGKGTGLGLATCYGIVKQSKGSIWVYSEPDNGTTFKIYLPRVQEGASTLPARPEPQPLLACTETILLVDDEAIVRELATTVLRKQGYRVLEAANGMEALRVYETCRGKIDLLITDLTMPVLGGKDLAAQVQQQQPDLPILFMSGYSQQMAVDQGALNAGEALLLKPFTAADLSLRARQLLETEPPRRRAAA